MGRVVGEPQEGPQLADVVHRRKGGRGARPGVEALDDVPRAGWAMVSVDGALDIRDQMTHTPVHTRQGKPTWPGLEGIEPARGDGVNVAECPDVPVREATVADHAVERRHQTPSGGMGATPIDGGRGHGMTGGAAQGIGSKVGAAECQVGGRPIEKVAAALPVMFHGSDGIGSSDWRLWGFGEAGFRIVVSTRPGYATIYPTFPCTQDVQSSLRAGADGPGGAEGKAGDQSKR